MLGGLLLALTGCSDDEPPVVATAAGLATPCVGGGQDATWEWIESVTIDGHTTTTGANGGYLPVDEPITVGESFTLTLTPGFARSPYQEHWAVWVDANGDGVFTEHEGVLGAHGDAPVSETVHLPEGTLPGLTHMRVAMGFGNVPPPCGSLPYGEVEDYVLSVPGTADRTSPVVLATWPIGSTGAEPGESIAATLSEAVDPGSVTADAIRVVHDATGEPVAGAIEPSSDPRVVRFRPNPPLAYSSTYTATLSGAITDLAGNPLGADVTWTLFTRSDPALAPPAIVGRDPSPGATGVPVSAQPTVTFDRAIDPVSATPANIRLQADGVDVPITVVMASPTSIRLVPAAGLTRGATHTITLGTGLRSARGVDLAGEASWSFATAQYCSTSGTGGSPWIARMRVMGHTFASSGGSGYRLLPTAIPVTLPASIGPVSLKAGYGSFNPPRVLWRGWVDWNRDGLFASDEVVIKAAGTSEIWTSFSPPPGVTLGRVRLRVAMRAASGYPDVYPPACGTGASQDVFDLDLDLQ